MHKNNVCKDAGPIAQKFIRTVAKYAKNKVIDLNAWKSAKLTCDQLEKRHQEKDLSELDPLHALYTDIQHRIADFIELFSGLPESKRFNHLHEKAEAMYMPSGPPMSPITKSYFYCWSAFDMYVGVKKETYTTIMIDFCKSLGADSYFINILKYMQQSRMGLYIVESYDDSYVYLRELYTNTMSKTLAPSVHSVSQGEIWLVRLLPDPTGIYFDYSIAFTTPYVIIGCPSSIKKSKMDTESMDAMAWIQFIDNNLNQTKFKDRHQAYEAFMKYGLHKMYWPEYIFQSYVNYTSERIWLTGFPDKPETLPHVGNNLDQP